ncbi:mRNA cap guanine-N7 methyltransferase, partial [Intoshia linei]
MQLGRSVQKFYDENVKTDDLNHRNESRIIHLRKFNNWVKSVLIDSIKKNDGGKIVLDLCCGKGGDIRKWIKFGAEDVHFVDFSKKSIDECRQRYNNTKQQICSLPKFKASFIVADVGKENIYKNLSNVTYDVVSCQFALHYFFGEMETLNCALENACSKIKPGGYFIGTIPNANQIVLKMRNNNTLSFGNEIYNICFDDTLSNQPPLLNAKYFFELEGCVNCPEYLVYFPFLIKLLEKYNLKCTLNQSFCDFLYSNYKNIEYKKLAKFMDIFD